MWCWPFQTLLKRSSHHKTPGIPSTSTRYGSSPPPTPSSPPTQTSSPPAETPSPPAQTPTICCLQLICLSSESADGGYVMWFSKGLKKSSQKGLWEENSWIAMGLKCICINGELETLLTTDSFSADSEDTWYMLCGFVRKKQWGCIWLRTSCCLSNRKDKHNLNFEDKKCCRRTQHSSCEPAIKRSCKCFEMLGRAFFGSNGGQGWQLQVTTDKCKIALLLKSSFLPH